MPSKQEPVKQIQVVAATQIRLWEYASALENEAHRQRLRELIHAALDAVNDAFDYYEEKRR